MPFMAYDPNTALHDDDDHNGYHNGRPQLHSNGHNHYRPHPQHPRSSHHHYQLQHNNKRPQLKRQKTYYHKTKRRGHIYNDSTHSQAPERNPYGSNNNKTF